MLPKGFRLQNEPFMDEITEPQGCSGCLEREVAKWQNRMIPILRELLSLSLRCGHLFDAFSGEFFRSEGHIMFELGAVEFSR